MNLRKIIALLTDFGLNDNFVGVMKGVIVGINPYANLVDICHGVRPQDISEAAFLVKGSYKFFPRGTTFLVVVDPGVGSKRRAIIIQTKNYFFIGPDNGVLGLAAKEDGIKNIILIENEKYFLKPISDTFHGRDIFAPVAAYISRGKLLRSFGRILNSIKELKIPIPEQKEGVLKGEIIYIDRFGNLVANIDKKLFYNFIQGKKFTQSLHARAGFTIRIKNKNLNSISRSYTAVRQGMPLAIFGSFGFLEISVNNGSAKEYFDAKKGEVIIIRRRYGREGV